MRGLKILVVVMSVMLVAGFAALIVAIAAKISHRVAAPTTSPAFAARAIDIPRGARVEAMTADTDRLVVDLALPDGGRRIIVVDLATGTRLGTIELHATP